MHPFKTSEEELDSHYELSLSGFYTPAAFSFREARLPDASDAGCGSSARRLQGRWFQTALSAGCTPGTGARVS